MPREGQGAVAVHRRSATPLRKGVMPMGTGRGARVLRLLVCIIVVLVIAVYFAPKAC